MGPGVDPHLYEATQSDIGNAPRKDLIFYSGLHLEANMMDVFSNTSVPALAVAEAIPSADLLEDEEEEGAIDPHVWFDPELWTIALDAAVEELNLCAPEHAEEFEQNKVAYFAELETLHQESKDTLATIPARTKGLVYRT